MAGNTSPIFVAVPRHGKARISTANTALDGTGTMGSVLVAGGNGSMVEKVRVKARGTTTAGMVRLFIDDGANIDLIGEVPVTAITPSGTVAAFEADWTPPGGSLLLPVGYTLKASTHNAEAFAVHAIGGDF